MESNNEEKKYEIMVDIFFRYLNENGKKIENLLSYSQRGENNEAFLISMEQNLQSMDNMIKSLELFTKLYVTREAERTYVLRIIKNYKDALVSYNETFRTYKSTNQDVAEPNLEEKDSAVARLFR